MKRGINLSVLLSIVMDFIILIFFNNNKDKAGMTKVVPNITAKQMSSLIKEISHIPEAMNIKNIHVGRKIGCVINDMALANLFISYELKFLAKTRYRNV